MAATALEKYAASLQAKTGLTPEVPVPAPKEKEVPAPTPAKAADGGLFDEAMLQQLNTVFSRMANSLILQLELDNRPVSAELKNYMENFQVIGNGGTDFRPAFEYVQTLLEKKEFLNLKGLLYFTVTIM